MKALAVVAHVVAAEQGNGAVFKLHSFFKDFGDDAVNGLVAARQIGFQRRIALHQFEMAVEIIARFGYGEGDHFNGFLRAFFNQRRQIGLPRNQLADRLNHLIFALAARADGFEHIFAVLRGERFDGVFAVVADITGRNRPTVVALLD